MKKKYLVSGSPQEIDSDGYQGVIRSTTPQERKLEASELRIGSIVKDLKGNKIAVRNICNEEVYYVNGWYQADACGSWDCELQFKGGTKVSDLSGIPLTPEWLEKAGFEKSKEGWTISNKYLEYEFRLSKKLGHDVPMCGCMCIKDFSQTWAIAYHIKYLHQLQNLYFALTGTELTFKP